MNKKVIFLTELNTKVAETVKFIKSVLYNRNDVNREILNIYIGILGGYLISKEIDTLHKLKEVYYRPSGEYEDTDYTEGTSLNFEGKYVSLSQLLIEIEDLIVAIKKSV